MSENQDRHYWVGLNLIRGIGPAKFRALLDFFGSAQAAWNADGQTLRAAGLDKRALSNLIETRSRTELATVVQKIESTGVSIITWEDSTYPLYLLEIADPPPVLYVRGDLQTRDQWAVAVVGTRRATPYGKLMTRELVTGLVQSGATIVSGLARGIDAIAHQSALEVGGRTIAVLGSGINRIYPPEHRRLATRVTAQGAMVSEFPPGTPPESGNFPRRNRIISGLSLGVLVVEAGRKSGAIITANYALDQGREVFAVPGNINSRNSLGTNRLIQQGAKLVLNANDILEELNMTMVDEKVATQLALPTTPEEARLLQLLAGQPCHVDELSRHSGLPVAKVTSTLTMMELKGLVQQVEGMSYVRAREPGVDYQVEQNGLQTEGQTLSPPEL